MGCWSRDSFMFEVFVRCLGFHARSISKKKIFYLKTAAFSPLVEPCSRKRRNRSNKCQSSMKDTPPHAWQHHTAKILAPGSFQSPLQHKTCPKPRPCYLHSFNLFHFSSTTSDDVCRRCYYSRALTLKLLWGRSTDALTSAHSFF